MSNTATAMTTKKETALSADKIPDFLQNSNLGNENVGADDLQTPRIKLLQQLSPELDENSASYVEGAKQGHMLNTVTGTVHDFIYVVNIFYTREFAVYSKRELGGGGFHGSASTESEAMDRISEIGGTPDSHVIRETGKHVLLLLNEETYDPSSEAMMLMDGSKLTVSNQWNSKLRMQNTDRFASVWKVGSVRQSNSKGQWWNFSIDFHGWVDKDLHEHAKTLYNRLANVN
tara:strand:- start:3923 stop:4615 length:693 start_codon:yes stop_codon:yes gene_type:complete